MKEKRERERKKGEWGRDTERKRERRKEGKKLSHKAEKVGAVPWFTTATKNKRTKQKQEIRGK